MGTSAFGQIFKEACENRKEEVRKPQVTSCYTCGYTKNAQPFIYQVESREYC
ncbi:MAG: hypothetical protein K2K54_06235 [Lachnospiraceae bacterium]|nr:hypothetical protein [Lachnospiraceae bacterium]